MEQPPQYFFRAKMCLKTRRNGDFQGGKPPGSNARGNPWGPARPRGGPRTLVGLFVTGFVVISNNFFGLFSCMGFNVQFPEDGFLLPTCGSWIQTSILFYPKSNFQSLDVDLRLTTPRSWTSKLGSGSPTSESWEMEIANRRMRRRPAAPILFPRENAPKNAEKR